MQRTRWWTYVETVVGDASQTEIAHRAGIDNSHVSNWKNKGLIPTAAFAVKFARAYGRNPVEAFVACEYITQEDADLREVKLEPEDVSDVRMLEILLDRAKRR